MIRTIEHVNKYLDSLPFVRRNPTERLSRVATALEQLGNPQDKVPAIHIAGTSGKGSTAYYAAELLRLNGYCVGLAVSPHVNQVTERSQVNGQPLPAQKYCEYFSRFVSLVDAHDFDFSYIEFLTVFTYWLFAELALDYMVIEVGLGGRLDATNTITRNDTIRVITDIGLDHTEILGDNLSDITREKAGVIHTSNTVVVHEQSEQIMDAVSDRVRDVDATLYIEKNALIDHSDLPIFQQRNWTLAHAAVSQRLVMDGKSSVLQSSIDASQQTSIPGRFEHFEHDGVPIILDAAHNPQKLYALIEGLRQAHGDKKFIFVVAFGNNKREALAENLTIIQPLAQALIATRFSLSAHDHRKETDPAVVIDNAIELGYDDRRLTTAGAPLEAFFTAVSKAKQDDTTPIVITGSFYLLDEIRQVLTRQS